MFKVFQTVNTKNATCGLMLQSLSYLVKLVLCQNHNNYINYVNGLYVTYGIMGIMITRGHRFDNRTMTVCIIGCMLY